MFTTPMEFPYTKASWEDMKGMEILRLLPGFSLLVILLLHDAVSGKSE